MAHNLTASWYKSSTSNYVTVNDVKVDVPYELKNGDIIKIYTSNGDSAGCLINGKDFSSSFLGSIDLSDTDINYTEVGWGPSFDSSSPVVTINYTEQSAPKVSVDLTTLPGWSSLSTGSHNITIVAKAAGYKDSEPSAAVNVEKAAPVYTDCITFTGETSDFTLKATNKEWDGTVEYSTDHNTWAVWNGTEVSSVDKKLYLRGSGNRTFCTSYGARFSLSALAGCSGNLNTLLEYSNPPTVLSKNKCYRFMFYQSTNLTTAPELPATTLTDSCYEYMFQGCTSLKTAPALPATTLTTYCYDAMFKGCANLTTAPALPATALTTYGYSSMFYGCTNLTTAPALPATALANSCYDSMFYGCTNLTTAPALPATTLAQYCYSNMFEGCTSLTAAPALPATTLETQCYAFMFRDCTSLKVSSIKTGAYQYAWRIPTSGTISSEPTGWNLKMLTNTGGTFTSDPSKNTTYYGAWTSATPTLISFTIAGTSYQAEEGMTWVDWVASSYNTGGFYIIEGNTRVIFPKGTDYVSSEGFSGDFANNTSQIVANGTYYKFSSGSGGGAK